MTERTSSFTSETDQDLDRLAQAGQILSHLQSQLDELDRREQQFNEQMGMLLDQQRLTQQQQATASRNAEKMRSELEERESAIVVAEQRIQISLADLQRREESLLEASRKIETERKLFANDMLKLREEFEVNCELELSRRRSELTTEIEISRQEFESECVRRKELLDKEEQRVRVELDEFRQLLLAEQDQLQRNIEDWQRQKEAEQQLIAEEKRAFPEKLKAEFEAEIAGSRAAIEHEQKNLASEIERHRQAVEEWLAQQNAEREAFSAEQNRHLEVFQQECNSRRAELDAESKELEQQKSLLQAAINSWEQQQSAERASFDRELQLERAEFENQLDAALQAFHSEETEARRKLDEELKQKAEQVVAELELQQISVQEECEQKRARLAEEILESRQSMQAQQARLDAAQEKHREQVACWEAEQQAAQTKFEESISQERVLLEAELIASRQAFERHCHERNEAYAESVEKEKESLREERARLRHELQEEMTKEKQELERVRQELESTRLHQEKSAEELELKRSHDESRLLESLEQLKKERLTGLDERERKLERREIDFDKRAQLHEAHLTHVRQQLRTDQIQLEKQRQQQQVWREKVEVGIRLRLNHMQRFRDLMARRESCLAEEQNLFAVTRQAVERDLARMREQFLQESESWSHQRSATIDRLQAQEEGLHAEYQVVLQSHQCLAEMCDQLEELMQQTKMETGEQSAHASRQMINAMLGVLGKQRREVAQATQMLEDRLSEIRNERAELANSVAGGNEAVADREQRFRQNMDTLALRESELIALRDQWNEDRLQAEQVIRELVVQLEVALDQIARMPSTSGAEDSQGDFRHAA